MKQKKAGILAWKMVMGIGAGIFLSTASYGGSPEAKTNDQPKETRLRFIENKGQWDNRAKYMAYLNGGTVFLSNAGFVYDYYDQTQFGKIAEDWHDGKSTDNKTINHHSFKVNFVNANTGIQYMPSAKFPDYNNYFIGTDSSKWIGKAGIYGRVEMDNVYNGIDLAVYGKGLDLKYDFIVKPGIDPSVILLEYEGVKPMLTANGHLLIRTSVNEINELAPFTYQMVNGKQKQIASEYTLKDNRLSFRLLDDYDRSLPLIIDPQLKYATYSGAATGSFNCMSTTYDNAGCLYASGVGIYANSPGGWPATTGAYQTTINGGGTGLQYGVINKYSTDGSTLVYSTYIGATGNTMRVFINSMVTTPQNELIIAGSVSGTGYPVTAGSYDQTLGGGTDIFVTKFKADGSALLQSTYVGGSVGGSATSGIGTEAGVASEFVTSTASATGAVSYFPQASAYSNTYLSPLDMQLDNAGNIWIASSTNATNFPVTTNAVQATFGGGLSDGVIFCLNPTLSSLVYGTYYGGSGLDILEGITIMPNGNIAVSGLTTSTNFTTTAGALKPTLTGGVSDGYVGIINPATGALVAATYLGTTAQDNACKVQANMNNEIYVFGRTNGSYPVSTGGYSIANGMLFIQKLNSTLTTSLASVRTGFPYTSFISPVSCVPTMFMVDSCGTVYLSCIVPALTTAAAFPVMPVTSNALLSTPTNFWCAMMSGDLSQLKYATYFGSTTYTAANISADFQNQGTHHSDPRGILYQSMSVRKDIGLGTTGSWSPHMMNPTSPSNSPLDIFSFKIDFQSYVQSDFSVNPSSNNGRDTGCAPLQILFANNSTASAVYTWDFGDGSPVSHAASPTHIFQTAGVYHVKLIAVDTTVPCHNTDTNTLNIVAIQRTRPFVSLNDTLLCSNSPVNIGATVNNTTPQTTYQWSPAAAIVSGNGTPHVTIDPTVSGDIILKAANGTGECDSTAEATMHITVSDIVNARVVPDDISICPGDTIPLTASGGNTYSWSPAYNISATNTDAVTVWPWQDMDYVISISDTNNCHAEVYAHVNVWENLDVDAGDDIDIRSGESVLLNGHTPGDYLWQYDVYPSGTPRPEVKPLKTTTYYLTGHTTKGCLATDSVTVYVTFANFPNAFSPNGDGLNDVFKLMPNNDRFRLLNFSVFDRWGNKLFYTEDINEGWDGTYKNKAADMGAYYYYVVYSIGTKNYTFKGDVTLIR